MATSDQKRMQILAQAISEKSLFNQLGFLVRQIIEERTTISGDFLNPGAKRTYSDKRAKFDLTTESYKQRREMHGLQTSFVDLQFNGNMWGSFDHDVRVNDLLVELGFNRLEMAKIASYHDLHGAGQNKVVREFLGLTDAETESVHDWLMQKIGDKFDITLEKNLPEL